MILKEGITLMHEHTIINLSHLKNEDCNFNDFDNIVEEFKVLYDLGVRNIVDVTNCGMGRNIKYINEVMKQTNINIICATGFYQDKYIPNFVEQMSIEQLTKFMINEIENGINETLTKAKIIGEIGTSKNMMSDLEYKVFSAACNASKLTKLKITTHCTLGTYALEQIEFFKKQSINLKNVVIGHLDLTGDINYILNVLSTGVYIEFDTVGKNNYMSDDVRIEMLKRISKEGFEDKVFLSMDITRKSNLKNNGGIGYEFLFKNFLKKCLSEGISQSFIDKMLIHNPQTFLNGEYYE